MTPPPETLPVEDTAHVLVVDDDNRIRMLLKKYLTDNGYRTSIAANASEARQIMGLVNFDLIIVDVMMPGESGLAFTQSVRAASNVPVLLLTARGLPEDRIEGLECGADDYLSKPFEPRELLLRINALLRRVRGAAPKHQELRFGACTFSPARAELRKDGELVNLTTGEAALLTALCRKPGAPISRLALAEQSSTGLERAIDVQVTRLRKKIENDPKIPMYLKTVRGVGYVLITD